MRATLAVEALAGLALSLMSCVLGGPCLAGPRLLSSSPPSSVTLADRSDELFQSIVEKERSARGRPLNARDSRMINQWLAEIGGREHVPRWLHRAEGTSDVIEFRLLLALVVPFATDEVRDFLVRRLRGSGGADIRAEALNALGEIGDPATVPAIAEQLSSSNTSIERLAVRVLGRFKTPNARAQLIQHCRRSVDFVSRHDCLEGLRGDTSKETRDLCLAMIADPQPDVRSRAAQVLANFRDEASLNRIESVLRKEQHELVRLYAVMGLENNASRDARRLLNLATQDTDPQVRLRAQRALARSRTQEAQFK